jgi:hypothetical protein
VQPTAHGRAALFAAMAMVVVVAANIAADRWRVDGREPPEYGTWSGVLELERKMQLLDEYASEGVVDALVLSSSMGDQGISAEVLTQDMSAYLGRTFRVFNFSMGGADLTSYAALYRLATVVSRPREIWIVSPVSGPAQAIDEGSLDDKLTRGAVAGYASVPGLLSASYRFHQLPIVRRAPAIRDAGLHLKFAARPVTNLDLYEISAAGDTISWLYNVSQYKHRTSALTARREEIMGFVTLRGKAAAHKYAMYFTPRTKDALEQLKQAAAADGALIRLVAFDSAAGLAMHDPEYLEASRRFFTPLSALLGGVPVTDVRASFSIEPYMVSDTIHLNAIGAREFSRLLAARMAGKPDPATQRFLVEQRIREQQPDPQWTPFTALVPRNGEDGRAALRMRMVQNWGVRHLTTTSNVRVAIRTSDGSEATLPAQVVATGEVVADTSGLALQAAGEILMAQLVFHGAMGAGIPLPMASFEWLGEKPDLDFRRRHSEARLDASIRAPTAPSPIEVSWSGIRAPSPKDWIGLFPAGWEDAERLAWAYTGGTESGRRTFPPLPRAGAFEARLFRADSWETIGVSEPFLVQAPVAATR